MARTRYPGPRGVKILRPSRGKFIFHTSRLLRSTTLWKLFVHSTNWRPPEYPYESSVRIWKKASLSEKFSLARSHSRSIALATHRSVKCGGWHPSSTSFSSTFMRSLSILVIYINSQKGRKCPKCPCLFTGI